MTTDFGVLRNERIGFIGCGAMGRALAGGLVSAGIDASALSGSDPAPESRVSFERELGIQTAESNAELVANSDVVVLAVKPGTVTGVLRQLSGDDDLTRPLWISIAAGISIASMEAALPAGARVIRAMPNTPALVGAGATAYCANAAANADDLAAAAALFTAVGYAWCAPTEPLLDAVTGLSGSGPAYVFLILEALADAGVRVGLPRDAAYQLAFQTVYGASKLVLESGKHPAALKDQVTSPGGTTIAGLERLEAGGVRAAIYEAVASATARSRELSEG
jgi:pyrroline-5-carboxylate reductase